VWWANRGKFWVTYTFTFKLICLSHKRYCGITSYGHDAYRYVTDAGLHCAVTSKVKVARSRDAPDRCWPIIRERNVIKHQNW